MKRMHLFEWEDQQWFPSFLRDYMTDFLQFVANQFDFYKGVVPEIKEGVEKSETSTIIDLASGGGGGWAKLSHHLKEEIPDLTIYLTDFYPNKQAFERLQQRYSGLFKFELESVNAMKVPTHLKGFRTQFLSFHHFRPEDARQILQNAVDSNQPIGIFEAQERDIPHLIKFLFSPVNVLLVTPFIRPFKIGRIIFTYLIPLVPLFVLWDGLVSVLRTYNPKDMEQMIQELNPTNKFDWEVGKKKSKGVTVIYTLGYPAASKPADFRS